MVPPRNRGPRLAASAVVLVGVLVLGIWLGGHPSWLPTAFRDTFEENSGGPLVTTVLDTMSRDYYRPLNRNQLLNRGLVAMVGSLGDPYTHYYSASAYQQFQNQSNPHFGGIGVDVVQAPAGLRVVDVFPDLPAAKAGLEHGDVITAVNSSSVAGRSADFASALIRGPVGSKVRLTVRRGHRTLSFSIVRANVAVPVASGKIVTYHGMKLGYLRFTSFTSGSGDQLRTDVRHVLHQGARGLVLDLRENGGGLLSEAVNVASTFIPDGTIVTTRGRSQPTQVYMAKGDAIAPKLPMVVLVDHDTASSAEIVTGALRDHGRAVVVGTRTYGKGVFQEIEPMPGGGALDLTVGEYFTPNGQNLGGGGVREGGGIRPNVYARTSPSAQADAALAMAERTLAARIR